jgi:hypothetical protein
MTYPTFIEIDGKRILWREIVQRRLQMRSHHLID